MAQRGRPVKGSIRPDDLPEILDYWNQALASIHGIRIESKNPNRLSQLLYKGRRECGHNAYNSLKVIETETDVWIVPRNE